MKIQLHVLNFYDFSRFRRPAIAASAITVALFIAAHLYVAAVKANAFDLFGPLPSLKDIENPEMDISSRVISADGVCLGRYYHENRTPVPFEKLPPHLVQTLIASEDHRFFEHAGVDLWSYLRVVKGIVMMENQGGGSTLTQQLAKNLFRTRSRLDKGTLAGKLVALDIFISKTKEWIIAVEIEKRFTKNEIIAMYLNTVPFNNEAWGIEMAARTYFSKGTTGLNLQEGALLVGMLQGTHRFNPMVFPDRAKRKRNEVLQKLFKHGYLSAEKELDSLKALPVELKFSPAGRQGNIAGHFVNNFLRKYVEEWCAANGYDLYESGLTIHVTLDSRIQTLAEQAVATQMPVVQQKFDRAWGRKNPWVNTAGHEIKNFLDRKIKQTHQYKNLVQKFDHRPDSIAKALQEKKTMNVFTWHGRRDTLFSSLDSLQYYQRFLQTGLMAMHPETGEIKAWVGGIDFKLSEFDHVKQSRRQGGSIFKAFVFGAAIEEGYSPCFTLQNLMPAVAWGGSIYQPTNYDGTYGDGTTYTLRQAMARSLNSITMQMVEKLTPENIIAFAKRFNISGQLDNVPSIGLGVNNVSLYEMVPAYASLVNRGMHTAPYFITRIEDKHGNVAANFAPRQQVVVDERTAQAMVYMLRGGVEEEGGTSRALSEEITEENEVGGKTGTTNDASDGWYIGVTHDLVTGVWVGGNEPSIHLPPALASGAQSALPIWENFMLHLYRHPELGVVKGKFKKDPTLTTEECTHVAPVAPVNF